MRVLPPQEATDAILTLSTVPEVAPAAYAGGTTYALGAQVSVASGSERLVYESLQAGNIGHTPASSPLWWVFLGTTYASWSSGTTYAAGNTVLDPTGHRVYESLVGSNLNQPFSDTTKWLDLGPSNRWAPFDLSRSTGATTPSPMTYVVTPGRRVDSVGLVGLVADSVTVTLTDGAETIYSRTIDLSARIVTGWYDYFFAPFTYKAAVALFDLPPVTTGVLSVTLERASGDVTLGGLLFGMSVFLGNTLWEPENDAENFSLIERDDFGTAILTQRRSVPITTQRLRTEKTNVNRVIAARVDLNAVPALWSGLDDAEASYFEPLLILGIYKRITVNMDNPDMAIVYLELEEV